MERCKGAFRKMKLFTCPICRIVERHFQGKKLCRVCSDKKREEWSHNNRDKQKESYKFQLE